MTETDELSYYVLLNEFEQIYYNCYEFEKDITIKHGINDAKKSNDAFRICHKTNIIDVLKKHLELNIAGHGEYKKEYLSEDIMYIAEAKIINMETKPIEIDNCIHVYKIYVDMINKILLKEFEEWNNYEV